MEKVLVLNGSPRGKSGNTNKLIEKFLEGYKNKKNQVEVNYIELSKLNINNCIGCFNCWTKTPGKCIHKDDMEWLLNEYIKSDLVIWATPLYHFEMTSIMKKFIERTLPLNEPYIINKNGEFSHPKRYDIPDKKNILIANCGFPQHHNFDIMVKSFDEITNNGLGEKILCVMGELLSKKPLEGRIKWYMDTVFKAGEEFALKSKFEVETIKKLQEPLVPIEDFIEMANLSWNAVGESSPSLSDAMGNNGDLEKIEKGFSYLKLMRQSFIGENAKGIDCILDIEFTDIKEEHHFIIKNEKCELVHGKNDDFDTKIITTYDVWLKISNGELDGTQAMMNGLYRVEGDFNFMMNMNNIFGGNKEKTNDVKKKENINKSILGINGEKWMGFSFIPWILSWIGISFSSTIGIWIPLIISLGIVFIKNRVKKVTHFEKMNVLYFSLLALINVFGINIVSANGAILNYFSMALIWGISLIDNKPLTADYSKYRFNVNVEKNQIFIRTNMLLTLFWSSVFLLEGIIFMMFINFGVIKITILLNILIIIALQFTNWFSKWYPSYIARGKR